MPTIRAVLACTLLGAMLGSCSGDSSDGSTGESAIITGFYREGPGTPMANASVWVLLSDTSYEVVGNRMLTTSASGRFSTTFDFPAQTLPLHARVEGRPEFGSGLNYATEYDSLMVLAPGESSSSLRYVLVSVQVEPSVIGIPAAPLSREAIVGRYVGNSVEPYDLFGGQVYIDSIVFQAGTGSDLGVFAFGYVATIVGGEGDVIGTVHDDTLFMQLSEVGEYRRSTSYKVIATSATADTLVAWPEPCSENCISKDSPIRLVRMP